MYSISKKVCGGGGGGGEETTRTTFSFLFLFEGGPTCKRRDLHLWATDVDGYFTRVLSVGYLLEVFFFVWL